MRSAEDAGTRSAEAQMHTLHRRWAPRLGLARSAACLRRPTTSARSPGRTVATGTTRRARTSWPRFRSPQSAAALLDERATGRDLAYLLRTKKMMAIRRAIHRGSPLRAQTSSPDLRSARRRRSLAGALLRRRRRGRTDGRLIVASELTPAGRRLYVTARDVFIGPNNIRGLSRPSSQ